jgi:uncharacterized Zn-binding protein involved in type VI secretion
MPPAATLSTIAKSEHIHIEKLCPLCIILPIVLHQLHTVLGPVVSGSQNVFINSKPAARVMDVGVAVPCCNTNTYAIAKGSPTVFINGRPAARIGDMTVHCSVYPGQLLTNGSPNVNIGDSSNMGFGFPGIQARSSIPDDTESHEPATASTDTAPTMVGEQSDVPKEPQTAQWRLTFSDGQVVRGALSDFHGSAGRKSRYRSDDGMHRVENLEPQSDYCVDLSGTESLRGKIVDDNGTPIAGAVIQVQRAYGEEHEDGSPMSNTEFLIHLADGSFQSLTSDHQGRFEHHDPIAGEGFAIEVIKYPGRAKGKLVAESGMAISDAKFMIQRHDGSVITAVTNESGDFDVDTLLPGEPYSITLANLE